MHKTWMCEAHYRGPKKTIIIEPIYVKSEYPAYPGTDSSVFACGCAYTQVLLFYRHCSSCLPYQSALLLSHLMVLVPGILLVIVLNEASRYPYEALPTIMVHHRHMERTVVSGFH